MSFGASPSDITIVVTFARRLYRQCRNAGGEYLNTSREIRSLHALLKHLKIELEAVDSVLNRDGQLYARELGPVIGDCDSTLRQLDELLQKHGRPASREDSAGELWDKNRFGSNELDELEVIRMKLVYHNANITTFLNTIQLHESSRVSVMVGGQKGQLNMILDKVDMIAARISKRADSMMTTYDDDDDDDEEVWKEFQEDLIAEGLSRDVLVQHKDVLQAYIRETRKNGLLDELLLDPQSVSQAGTNSERWLERIPVTEQSSYLVKQPSSSFESLRIKPEDTTAKEIIVYEEDFKFPLLMKSERARLDTGLVKDDSRKQQVAPPHLTVPCEDNLVERREGIAISALPLPKLVASISVDAKWTKIRRALISTEVLEQDKRRYEATPDFVAILGALSREEVEEYVMRSKAVREARMNRQRFESSQIAMQSTEGERLRHLSFDQVANGNHSPKSNEDKKELSKYSFPMSLPQNSSPQNLIKAPYDMGGYLHTDSRTPPVWAPFPGSAQQYWAPAVEGSQGIAAKSPKAESTESKEKENEGDLERNRGRERNKPRNFIVTADSIPAFGVSAKEQTPPSNETAPHFPSTKASNYLALSRDTNNGPKSAGQADRENILTEVYEYSDLPSPTCTARSSGSDFWLKTSDSSRPPSVVLSSSSFSLPIAVASEDTLKAIRNWLATLFLDHHAFNLLCTAILDKIGASRFEKNVFRYLCRYAVQLRKEAKDWLQISCSRLIHQQALDIVKHLSRSLSSGSETIHEINAQYNEEIPQLEQFIKSRRAANSIKEKASHHSYDEEYEELTNIEEVGEDIGEEEELESETPSLENLEHAKAFMIDGKAFRLLFEDIRILAFPIMSQYITTTIESTVKSIDGNFDIRCVANWEVIQYCQEELAGSWNLHRVLTLTGSPAHAQAASCEDYMSEIWHRKGQILLNSFVRGVKLGTCHVDFSGSHKLDIIFAAGDLNIGQPETADIRLSGTIDEIVGTLNQLAWFAANFRVSKVNGLTMSYALFQSVNKLSDYDQSTPPSFLLSLCLPRQEPKTNAKRGGDVGKCWLPLFKEGVLAHGFPIANRGEFEGLEIPFPLMAAFTKVTCSMEHNQGVILLGESSLLFPSKRICQAVQWHYVEDDNVQLLVNALDQCGERVLEIEIRKLTTLRTFLGYYKRGLVLAGTKELLQSNFITNSNIPVSKSRIELVREGTASFGLSVNQIINSTVGSKWVLPKGLRVSLAGTSREYEDRLEKACDRSILVYDWSIKSAWLVSELSMTLHLAHTYLRQPKVRLRGQKNNREGSSPWHKLPYARSSSDGGKAAFDAIREYGDLELYTKQEDGKPKQFWSVIDDFLKDLGAIRNATNIKKASAGWQLVESRLQGWEFNDLATKEDYVSERELPSDSKKSSWWQLRAAEEMLVIFGCSFGQLIVPDLSKTKVYSGWNVVPSYAGLLTASMYCVKQLARKCNTDGLCDNLTSQLMWHRPRSRSKGCCDACNHSCLCIQEIRSRNILSKWSRISQINPPGNVILNEVVMFGDPDYYHESLRTNSRIAMPQHFPSNSALKCLERSSALLLDRTITDPTLVACTISASASSLISTDADPPHLNSKNTVPEINRYGEEREEQEEMPSASTYSNSLHGLITATNNVC